jgi:hypothetical protein
MKKLGLLVLVLVLAVASLGVGYAFWTENLFINATVASGDLDVVFDGSASIVDADGVALGTITPALDGKTATLSITNAYPGAVITVPVTFKNEGSIPAIVGEDYWMDPAGNDEYFVLADATLPTAAIAVGDTASGTFTLTVGDVAESTTYQVTIGVASYQAVP